MHGQQVGSGSFFGGDVIDKSPSDSETAFWNGTAAGALAAFFDRSKVFGIGGVTEVENSCCCDGIAKALV